MIVEPINLSIVTKQEFPNKSSCLNTERCMSSTLLERSSSKPTIKKLSVKRATDAGSTASKVLRENKSTLNIKHGKIFDKPALSHRQFLPSGKRHFAAQSTSNGDQILGSTPQVTLKRAGVSQAIKVYKLKMLIDNMLKQAFTVWKMSHKPDT